jgi:hypothetical protein
MTDKEKLIIKKLGYTTYVMYQYIKFHPKFHNKDMQWELGLSKESTYRSFNKLKKSNIIKVTGHNFQRRFTILPDNEWDV